MTSADHHKNFALSHYILVEYEAHDDGVLGGERQATHQEFIEIMEMVLANMH